MWGKALPLGRVRGIDLRLDLSWFLIATLLTLSLSSGYFPGLLPGAGPAALATAAATAVIGLFGSILLHELGHALVAQAHRMEVRTITLFVFGGVAELAQEPPDAGTEFRVAVAGPLVSFGLAAAGFGLSRAAEVLGAGALPVAVLRYLTLANLVLAVFNLLPAFPLDGGRVLRAWLWSRGGDMTAATRAAARLSSWIAGGLIALGLLGLISGSGAAGLWPAALGLFVLAAAQAARAQVDIAAALEGRRVAEVMQAHPVCVAPSMPLGTVVEEVMLRHGLSFLPVVEDGRLLGTLDLRLVREIDRDLWPTTQVGDVFAPISGDDMVAPDALATRVFERMTGGGPRKLAVVRAGRLVGIVTLADLITRVRLQGALEGVARS